MKIAILTQPLCNNYGGILQNYAMQTVLQRLGHEPVTLHMAPPEAKYSRVRLLLSCCKRFLKKYFWGDPAIVFVNPLKQHRKAIDNAVEHRRFIEKYITTESVELPLTVEFASTHDFGVYLVGSDQVWRPRYNTHLQNFYLDFTQGYDVRRIAYAASFGVDNWEADENTTTQIRLLAQNFDGISVREESGVELCRKYLGVEAQWVLDPTMLLSVEDYLELVKAEQKSANVPYIGAYLLDLTKEKLAAVERLSRELSLPIRYLGRMTRREYPSIESWLAGIANAEYVVTDSFHGTVFSIIFRKQFLSVYNLGRGNARFESLLSKFDLCDRLVAIDAVNKNKISDRIDYSTISEKLSEEQDKATRFIDKILKRL